MGCAAERLLFIISVEHLVETTVDIDTQTDTYRATHTHTYYNHTIPFSGLTIDICLVLQRIDVPPVEFSETE